MKRLVCLVIVSLVLSSCYEPVADETVAPDPDAYYSKKTTVFGCAHGDRVLLQEILAEMRAIRQELQYLREQEKSK